MNTFDTLKQDLVELGLKQGDTVFLRISYKAIGKVDGGPKTFLDAVLAVVGKEGTVLLTAFPMRYKNKLKMFHKKDAVEESVRPKTFTGALSSVGMQHPDALMSARIDFPFVAIGKHAEYLTTNHTYDKNGYWILEEAIEKFNCICLRVGGEPFIGTTHMSLSHVLQEKGEYQMAPRYGLYVKEKDGLKWRENNNVIFCPTAFKNYLPQIIDEIRISEGKVGEGYAIITDMKKSLQKEEQLFRKDLKTILCSNPDCCICRTTFSFSDSSKTKFLIKQFAKIFKGNARDQLRKIKNNLDLHILFSVRND